MIVLDTSFLVGLYVRRDAHHAASRALQEEFDGERWGRGLLLEYVFLETLNVLLNRSGLAAAAAVAQTLCRATELDYVPCSALFTNTVEAFCGQQGTKLSFTDVAIAQFALRHADGNVLTFDHEFRKIPALRVYP